MDPNALVADVIATRKITSEQRDAYREWISRGGFPARVGLHPATVAWMRGDRFGQVVRIGRSVVVRADRSGREYRLAPADVLLVVVS